MSDAARALDPADEAVLAALATRLNRVDDELSRSTGGATVRADAPHLHVVRGRTMRRGARAVALGDPLPAGSRVARWRAQPAALLLAIGVVLAVVAGRSIGETRSSALPVGAASPSAAASALVTQPSASSATASGRPMPVPTSVDPSDPAIDPGLESLRGAMAIVSWPCAVTVRVAHDPIAPGLVAKLELTRRLPDGFVPGGLDPIWSGSDPETAARAFKGRLVATATTGDVWTLRRDGSGPALLELVVQQTPSGSALWRSADVAWPIACAKTGADPKVLLVGHAGADWPNGQVIDIAVVELGAPGRLPPLAR